tara:strand:+ start:667 stop:777 length:111 start_codon:yes stop_codon:yes gene_type:complete
MKIDEITNIKLHTCLMHLSFETDKAELENYILNAKR